MKPLIAITAGEVYNQIEPWSPVIYGQSRTYVDAILRVGGNPLILPIMDDALALRQIYELVDGILFAGGNDIDSALYGEMLYPETKDVSTRRDALETDLMRWALADHKPLPGICRGMQILNIVQGGTLYQHIPTDLPYAADHDSSTKRKDLDDIAHILRINKKTRLAAILQAEAIGANTHHHQAVKELGKQLIGSAWAEDGVIEGIEHTDDQFAIGLQCHPESLESSAETQWQRLFRAFVSEAAGNRRRAEERAVA
jgi:putative glutamine amidotransferase